MARPADRRTPDFFGAQAAARRRTFLLLSLFLLAWLGTIALVDLGLAVVLAGERGPGTVASALLLPVALAVSLVILLGGAFHAARLAAGGGEAVAEMLGGRPVDSRTQDPAERRLVNVVEEMAIAAGLPAPRLHLLQGQDGINAFAAGLSPDRSVVAVTGGALRELSRDELQGVVAHELSHVLNADTRLNMRLMAAVGGLTALALLGRILLRASRGGGRGRGAILGAGLCLLVAGSVGAFFGRLIRLAVSRQREFLADAAAVQFTRNPDGLAGALSKIARQGSRISSPYAVEAAHLFFADGLGDFLSGLFATHPPVEERIGRLLPQRALLGAAPPHPASAGPGGLIASDLVATVGRLEPQNLAAAGDLLAGLPARLAQAAREPFGARCLACALVLDGKEPVRSRQVASLERDAAVLAEVRRLAPEVDAVPREVRMALLDLALPALDRLSRPQADALAKDLASLAAADGLTTVFEWAVQRVVRRRLAPPSAGGLRPRAATRLDDVEMECLELLTVLARVGQRDDSQAQQALEAGVRALGVNATWRLLPRDRVGAARLDAALARLDQAAPSLKARVLASCAACVLADDRVSPAEAEMVRAVAASLGCPMPPLPAGRRAPPETAAAG